MVCDGNWFAKLCFCVCDLVSIYLLNSCLSFSFWFCSFVFGLISIICSPDCVSGIWSKLFAVNTIIIELKECLLFNYALVLTVVPTYINEWIVQVFEWNDESKLEDIHLYKYTSMFLCHFPYFVFGHTQPPCLISQYIFLAFIHIVRTFKFKSIEATRFKLDKNTTHI